MREGNSSEGTSSAVIEPVAVGKKTAKEKIDLSGLSHDKVGYGQGVLVDEKNRTTGALDFNAQYGKLNAKAINNDNKIYLTFDQGYENGYTEKILDVLKEKKVKATFFLLQDYAEKNPELVKRMIDEGHIVGNHSVHHYSMPTLGQAECESEIKDFHKYMEDNYMFDLSLDSVSEILHISPAYLSAQFKKYQKMNFLDCLTELRINAAKELLTDPFRSAAEVASMVGYEDSSYFARTFKKRTGMTPTQYRREAAKAAREARL